MVALWGLNIFYLSYNTFHYFQKLNCFKESWKLNEPSFHLLHNLWRWPDRLHDIIYRGWERKEVVTDSFLPQAKRQKILFQLQNVFDLDKSRLTHVEMWHFLFLCLKEALLQMYVCIKLLTFICLISGGLKIGRSLRRSSISTCWQNGFTKNSCFFFFFFKKPNNTDSIDKYEKKLVGLAFWLDFDFLNDKYGFRSNFFLYSLNGCRGSSRDSVMGTFMTPSICSFKFWPNCNDKLF